jgi:hypothetical protein
LLARPRFGPSVRSQRGSHAGYLSGQEQRIETEGGDDISCVKALAL